MRSSRSLSKSLLFCWLSLGCGAAFAVAIDNPPIPNQSENWLAAGDSLREARQSEAAIKAYETALAESRIRGDNLEQAELLRRLGEVRYEAEDLQTAETNWQEALTLYRQLNRRDEAGEILKSIGWIHDDRGEYPQALKYYGESLQIARASGNDKLAAQCLNNTGVVYDNLSEPKQALEYYRQSLELRRKLKDVKGEASTLNNMGMAYDVLSDHRNALELYRQSLTKFSNLGDSSGISRVLGNQGVVYEKISNYPKALEAYRQSLAIKSALGDRRGEGATLNNIGIIYDLLSDHRRALAYYRSSLEIAKELEDPKGQAETLDNIGVSQTLLHEYALALISLQQSLEIKTGLGDHPGQGVTLNGIGYVYATVKDYTQALDYYQQDLQICVQVQDRLGECLTLANISEVYTQQLRYPDAFKTLQRAMALSRDLKSEEAFQSVYHGFAKYYIARGEDSLAVGNYRSLIGSYERVRQGLEIESHKRTLAQGTAAFYGEMIQALLRLNHDREAFDYCERSRSRAFLDLLAAEATPDQDTLLPLSSTLATDYHLSPSEPELSSPVSAETLTLPQIQQQLRGESTLLEYFIAPEQTAIWVVTREQTQVFQVSINADSLKYLVRGLRDAIVNQGAVSKRARRLYDLLIQPVSNKLQTEDLIIVPHGVLHYLPFALLEDDQGRKMLDRYALRFLPSASVLKYLPNRPPEPAGRMLALGNPRTDRTGYGRLPFSEIEVNAIAAEFPRCDKYIGSAATESIIKRLAPQYSILHLACHSDLDASYPLFSGLLLAPGDHQDGELHIHEIFKLKLCAWLVTLSSCRTGLGYLTNGDDLVGLSRAFIYAGAPSVLVSLWQVEDESTAYLMTRFYYYLATQNKAQALRKAQADTMAKFRSARSWAAFVLVGEAH